MDLGGYWAKPNKTIRQHVEECLKEFERLKKLGYVTEEPLIRMAEIALRHHDDGKISAEFQRRVLDEHIKFNAEKEIPHNVLSGFLLNPEEFEQIEDYYRVLYVIMYHHDYGDPQEIMTEKKELIRETLNGFKTYKITTRVKNNMLKMILDRDTIRLKGYLHKCDYSASGGYACELPNDFLTDGLEHVLKKWKEKNESSEWNEMQKFCMENRNENLIVVAQTGMGKTEAGLQWIGNGKGFFVLPIRAAINAIYDRVRRDILLDERINERVSILHSESLEYYMNQQYEQELDLVEYENRGKHLTLPLNISTADQLFDFVLKYQGYELKLTILSYSRIVIDEIQMYDPELLHYLIFGLKWIAELGGKVAIMTATLSPFVKELLMREIPFKESHIRTFVNDMLRHHIQIREKKINEEDIIGQFLDNANRGKSNKILVVCNTIHKAQELYEKLEQSLDNREILHILHSRFTREDREKLEREILKFGRTYDESGKLDCQSGIWISTSLVEASLDIDFDYLFTELQDLNSLFQRFGRCNRKGVKDITEPNCFVYTVVDANTLSKGGGFIDSTLFEISKKAIEEGNGLLSETRKIELINQYLTMERLKDSKYYEEYTNAEWIERIEPYKFEKGEGTLRNILSETVIPSPVYEIYQEEILDCAKRLQKEKLDYEERVRLKQKIIRYTVSIPYKHWCKYEYERKKGNVEPYTDISLGGKHKIPIMECRYDKKGYRSLDYENVIREAKFI